MNARRKLILSTLSLLLLAPMLGANAQTAPAERPHKVVLQVSDADPAKWNLALNNARNVQQDLGSDKVAIEIVAYGPGIGMLKLESVAGARVSEAMASGMSVVACENTMRNQKITRDDMLPKIGYVGAGVVQLMARQKEGYAYIRP
ncbi:MAG: DsrE family protein [Rubrivivax sp.]|nr:DsrE family protein [Rubrivivax sp.]